MRGKKLLIIYWRNYWRISSSVYNFLYWWYLGRCLSELGDYVDYWMLLSVYCVELPIFINKFLTDIEFRDVDQKQASDGWQRKFECRFLAKSLVNDFQYQSSNCSIFLLKLQRIRMFATIISYVCTLTQAVKFRLKIAKFNIIYLHFMAITCGILLFLLFFQSVWSRAKNFANVCMITIELTGNRILVKPSTNVFSIADTSKPRAVICGKYFEKKLHTIL